MAKYSADLFYKQDGTLDTELVDQAISTPVETLAADRTEGVQSVEAPAVQETQNVGILPIGSQVLADLEEWKKTLTPKDRVSNRLKDYDPESVPEAQREGVNKAVFEHLCTSPEYLGWGGASANERGVFGLPYGSKTWTQKVQMLKDWSCGNGQMMSDEQEELTRLEEEAKQTGDYSKVNALVKEKSADIWDDGADLQRQEQLLDKYLAEKLPEEMKVCHDLSMAKRDLAGRSGQFGGAKEVADLESKWEAIDPDLRSRYKLTVDQFRQDAAAQIAADRRKQYRQKLDMRNTLQMLELNGETMSDRSRAFVAATAANGVFDSKAFMSLPDAEKGHVLACVKIRRGEMTEGYGFIPLKDEKGNTIDTGRILYGIGRSITDIPADTMRTLGDWCDVANAELGTNLNPLSIMLDPDPWYMKLPKAMFGMMWNSIGKTKEEEESRRKNAYAALELKHKIRNAMTQEMPEASNFWTRSGAGFGDNFGFLLISEVGAFGKLAASRGLKIAQKAAEGGKVGAVDRFLFRDFVKAGQEIGKGTEALKSMNLANAPRDVRSAVKAFMEAKNGLPAAQAEYNAALHQFNLAKKTGVNMSEAAERLAQASAKYAKYSTRANPTVAYEQALSNGQFFTDVVKVREQIDAYTASIKSMGKGIEMAGTVAEQAMWYLPFYTRQLDRAVSQGLPIEQAAHRAFVTMISSGWTEKKAITMAAKMGLPAKTLTEQSWKTIITDFRQAFAKKSLGAAGDGLKALGMREVTNVAHGIDSAINVTGQSIMDECALVLGEIWDETKRDWDRGYTVRKDADGNPIKNFNGDTIVDAFGTKDAFMRFANAILFDGKMVETALNVVKEGTYPAIGFAALSGVNARFGHWRHESMMRSNLKAGMGEQAYSNYALKDGGLAEVYDGMQNTQDAVYQFALNDVLRERREAIDNVRAAGDAETAAKMEEDLKKNPNAVAKEAGSKYAQIMGRVMNAIEQADGSVDQVQSICDNLGVDANTAELLKSMSQDYSALRWRDDFNSIFGNFAKGMEIGADGQWQKMRQVLTIRNAEFAFRNFVRLAPNVKAWTDHGDGTMDMTLDLGNGREVTVGVAINQQITQAVIEDAIKGGEVPRLYESMHGKGSWALLDRAEQKDFAAEYIEGNNRNGGGFYFIGSDGKKYLMPIKDVADFITLTDKGTGHAMSHEVSHTIYRAAEEMGFIDLNTKGAIADALAIDRVGEAATKVTNEIAPDGHRMQAWEIEVDEAVARGYADYTNGRSMIAVPAVRDGFDKVNKVFDFLRGIFLTEAVNNETALDDFYEAMMRGDLESLKDIVAPFARGESADKKLVRDQALEKVQAARELLKKSSEQGKDQARAALKAAQAELAKANAEYDKVRRAKRANVAGGDQVRNSLVTPEQAAEWMPDTKVVDENGKPMVVYHGTVRDFTVFDKSFSNPDSDMGSGYYFSNSEGDVDANYATTDGADLTNRIEMMADQIEMEEDENGNLPFENHEDAVREAHRRLNVGNGRKMKVFLNITNPFVIGASENPDVGEKSTWLDYISKYNEETEEYGEHEGSLIDFVNTLQEVLADHGVEHIDVTQILESAMDYEGMNAAELARRCKEMLAEVQDEEGNFAGNEFFREAVERAGFDGIIDKSVNYKFGTRSGRKAMEGMHDGTVHYIAFDPRQIKSADGTTYDDAGNPIPMEKRGDLTNEDIRYSLADSDWQKIENHFGVTKDARESGFITPSGKMLDFSGRHWGGGEAGSRQVDHRDIAEVMNGRDYEYQWSYVQEALDSGAIRVMPEIGAMTVTRDINEAQEDALYDWIAEIRYESEDDFMLEFCDARGRNEDTIEFNRQHTNPRAIIQAIHDHYAAKTESVSDVDNGSRMSLANEEIAEDPALIGKAIIGYKTGNRAPDLTMVDVYNERTGKMEKAVAFAGDVPDGYEPKRIGYAYKLMEQYPDGSLHALFADRGNGIMPNSSWMFAKGMPWTDKGVSTMKLRERYAWHMGFGLPSAPHLMSNKSFDRGYPSKKGVHPNGSKRVWVKVAFDASADYNALADQSTGEGDIFGMIPFGGWYGFIEGNKSNWILSSAVKFMNVLTEEERQKILADAGYDEKQAWQARHDPSYREANGLNNKKTKALTKEEKRKNLEALRQRISDSLVDNPDRGNFRSVESRSMDGFVAQETKTNDAGETVVEIDGDRQRFSLATWEDGGRDTLQEYLGKEVSEGRMKQKDAKAMLDEMDLIHKAMTRLEDKYVQFGAWSRAIVGKREDGTPVMCVIKTNGDYNMNLDFSTLCKKRRAFDRVIREIIKRGNIDKMKLDEANFVEINKMIREAGFEVACELCFVDSKRYRGAGIAAAYANMYNRLVNTLLPEGEGVTVEKFNLGENPDLKRVKGKALHKLTNGQVEKYFDKLDAEVEKMRKEIIDSKWDEKAEKAKTNASSRKSYENLKKSIPASKKYDAEFAKQVLSDSLYQGLYGGLSKLDVIAKHLKTDPLARRHLVREDLIDSTGFYNAYAGAESIVDLYNNMGTAKPKETLPDVQFIGGEITGAKSWTPESAYSVGGVRVQSFSDFVPHMVFDYMQMFAELAAKGLPAHAYTKEELFVEIFGKCGLKINMSLVPFVDERLGTVNGKNIGHKYAGLTFDGSWTAEEIAALKFDKKGDAILTADQEKRLVYLWNEGHVDTKGNKVLEATRSFPFEKALVLQGDAPDKNGKYVTDYRDNCGTIAVGVSDMQIWRMLDDESIRMIIPYHKSSVSPIVARLYGIDLYTDYTDIQTTKGAKAKEAPNFNELLREHKSARKAANAYLKWCKDNNCTPKFEKFSKHKNYYKMLQDFTCEVGGKYKAQMPITMTEKSFPKDWLKIVERGLGEDDATAAKLDKALDGGVNDLANRIVRELGVSNANTGRYSLAVPPELSGALSTEDLLRMAAAGRIAKNKTGEGSVRADLSKRLKDLNHDATDADVERLMGEAKREANAIVGGMENTADAEIMNRLTARQLNKYLSSLRQSGRKGIGEGVKSERARQELDDRYAQKIADSIAAQTGISVNELEASLGVDLAETMTILGDLYQEAEKAAMGESNVEADENADEVETPVPDGADDPVPLTPEEQAKREADIRALCQDIMRKAWEKDEEWKKRKAEAKAKRDAKKAAEGETDAEEVEGAGEELPTTADDLATFICTKQAIDLRNPNQFAQFIAIMCEEKWKKDHGLAADQFVWSDPVALQHLRMTAAGVYDSLARKLMYSNRRETAFNAIAEMENCPTFGSLISKMEFTGKVIAQGMVTEKANELVTDIERLLKQAFGAKGRFSQNKENKDRKVSGLTELWARDVRKVLRYGDEKISTEYNLLMQRLAGVEAAFQLAGRDPQSAKQFTKDMRMIEVLHDFGGLIHKSLGEITDARIKILDRLENDTVSEEAQDREDRTIGIAEMIEKAVETGRTFAYDDKHINAMKKTGRSISKFFQEHLDFKHLLLDLARYCKDEQAKATYEEWVNNLQHEIQRRWDKAQTEKRVEALAFKSAIEAIYGGKYDTVMRELLKHDERFDAFGEMIERQIVEAKPESAVEEMKGGKKREVERKFKVSMSKAQAMNLYVALQQKGYLDNVVKNNRQGQAAELRKLFTKEDLQVIKWLGDWYDRSRQGISEVSMRIFGLPVEAEESNYFPVTPHRATQGLNEMSSDTWSPFPPALTPRVKHGLDFDVRTDIFSVWMERMQDQAQWKNMAEFGVELRGIFGRQGLQSTIRHCHGDTALANVKAFINDILRGQVQIKGRNAAIDWMRGWTALSALGGNLGVMLKQTTSIPAFAFEVGFVNTAKYLNPVEMFSAEGIAAMKAIWNSDQRKNRWDSGNSEEVSNAFADSNPSALKRLMQKSMVFNKIGDCVPALTVGQGIYRAYLAQGISAEEAMNRTWELINRTQQTGQMDNLTGFQRRSSLGRFATQFQTTVRQYTAYEVAAIRNALANPSKKTSIDLLRATACNAVLASLYYCGGAIWQWVLGRKPDEETVDGWVKSVLNSCWTSLFFAGAFVQSVSDIIVDGQTRQGASIPSMALTGTVLIDMMTAIRALIDEEKDADDVLKSIDHGLKAFSSPYRDLSKVYHWRIQGEPPNAKNKTLKKKALKKKKPLKRR